MPGPSTRRSRPGRPPLPSRGELGLVAELPAHSSGNPHDELARITQENAQLHEALRSRTVLGQATGLLMAALRLSPDEAFAALTKMSSHENRKVRDVAAGVVARRTRPGLGR